MVMASPILLSGAPILRGSRVPGGKREAIITGGVYRDVPKQPTTATSSLLRRGASRHFERDVLLKDPYHRYSDWVRFRLPTATGMYVLTYVLTATCTNPIPIPNPDPDPNPDPNSFRFVCTGCTGYRATVRHDA